jgi:hypothetical protein
MDGPKLTQSVERNLRLHAMHVSEDKGLEQDGIWMEVLQ